MRIALVHDWLLQLGGAERVLIALHRIFPEAPIYALFYDKVFINQHLPSAKIIPSFLQRLPNIKKLYPWFKFLFPLAIESFDFSGFDLVVSSSHEISHGVLTKPETKHICFYHSPSRLLWDRAHEYLNDFKKRGRGNFKLSLIRAGQHFLRLWDWSAGQRPDIVLANSKHVAQRIKKYYGREAKVVYPPVEGPSESNSARSFSRAPAARSEVVGRFASLRSDQAKTASESAGPVRGREGSQRASASNGAGRTTLARLTNYFLIVSQLYPHKNVDLAIRAFKDLPELNLLIAGDGPEKKRLKKLIGDSSNIKLMGFVPDEELPYYYQNCSAYLICNEEDFGISPVEAMSFGKPVLALRRGGAMETILENKTGEFFDPVRSEDTLRALAASNGVNDLVKAIQNINQKIKNNYYNPEVLKKHSERFSRERFKKELLDIIKSLGYNFKS